MNIQPSVSFIQNIDRVLDYIPAVSIVSAIFQIFQKCVLFKVLSEDTINRNHYFQLVKDKPVARCVILLIPFLGNVVVAIYDFVKIYKASQKLVTTEGELKAYKEAIQKIKTDIKCVKCAKIALLPLVTGTCGHIICEPCTMEEEYKYRNPLRKMNCPSPNCSATFLGYGLPLPLLKNILVDALSLQPDPLVNKEQLNHSYKEKVRESNIFSVFRRQSELAVSVVERILSLPEVTFQDWQMGIYIKFEANTNVFFAEQIALNLGGKLIGEGVSLTVLVDFNRMMLAVQADRRGLVQGSYKLLVIDKHGNIQVRRGNVKGEIVE